MTIDLLLSIEVFHKFVPITVQRNVAVNVSNVLCLGLVKAKTGTIGREKKAVPRTNKTKKSTSTSSTAANKEPDVFNAFNVCLICCIGVCTAVAVSVAVPPVAVPTIAVRLWKKQRTC